MHSLADSDRIPAAALILATRSADKAAEIRDIFAPAVRAPIITLVDAHIEPQADEDAIEAYDTFLANAHAKAEYFMRLTGQATLADDSGICVDALGGAPGVRSRRFAARPGLDGLALDRANNERLLLELRDTPDSLRTAHYTCAAVLHSPDGRRFSAIGTCTGLILHEPRGTGGFGYDPLFLIPQLHLSFGETPSDVKHRYSHRGRAFRALAGAAAAAVSSLAARPSHP